MTVLARVFTGALLALACTMASADPVVRFDWRPGDQAEVTFEKSKRPDLVVVASSRLTVKPAAEAGRLAVEFDDFKLTSPSEVSASDAAAALMQEVMTLVMPNFTIDRAGGDFKLIDPARHLAAATKAGDAILAASGKAVAGGPDTKTILERFTGKSYDDLLFGLAQGTWRLWAGEWVDIDLDKLPVTVPDTMNLFGQDLAIDINLTGTKLDSPGRWRLTMVSTLKDKAGFAKGMIDGIERTIGGTANGKADVGKLRNELTANPPNWSRRITVDLDVETARPQVVESEDTVTMLERGASTTRRQYTRFKFEWRPVKAP